MTILQKLDELNRIEAAQEASLLAAIRGMREAIDAALKAYPAPRAEVILARGGE